MKNDKESTRHILLETVDKRSTNGYICVMMTTKDKVKRTSIYGCSVCKRGFHVNCFALYHFENDLAKCRQSISHDIDKVICTRSLTKNTMNQNLTCTTTLSDCRLPFVDK